MHLPKSASRRQRNVRHRLEADQSASGSKRTRETFEAENPCMFAGMYEFWIWKHCDDNRFHHSRTRGESGEWGQELNALQ
jgi:hypothetical protein